MTASGPASTPQDPARFTRSGDAAPGAASLVDPAALLRVLAVLEKLNASNDLAEVLHLINDSVRDCLHAERASVFQYDPRGEELVIHIAHGVKDIRLPINSRGIAAEAARTRQLINVPDAWEDPRFNPEFDKKNNFRTRGLLTIPLIAFDGSLQGVVQALNKNPLLGPHFDASDEVLARALASQAAIALRRASLIEAEIRKKKIEGDLAVARTIQQASLPKTIPQIPGYDITAHMSPADETGGDTFDVINLADFSGSLRGIAFIIGDATGHGIGPALSVAQARAMVRMGIRQGASLDRIAHDLNAQLCDDLPAGRFITAFFGRLDPDTHQITYVAPGQAPLLLLRADGSFDERAANAMPLGIDPDLLPDPIEPLRLNPGDSFLLLSDGFLEAQDPSGEQFGVQRAIDAMHAAAAGSARDMLAALQGAVRAFVKGRPFGDDQTAVIVKRLLS